MQPIGAPVGSNIRAMAPNGADLLSTDGLPHALAIRDGAASEEKLPVCGVDVGKGRCSADHLPAFATKNDERPDDDDGQSPPVTLI